MVRSRLELILVAVMGLAWLTPLVAHAQSEPPIVPAGAPAAARLVVFEGFLRFT
jgi:hypothetical protein